MRNQITCGFLKHESIESWRELQYFYQSSCLQLLHLFVWVSCLDPDILWHISGHYECWIARICMRKRHCNTNIWYKACICIVITSEISVHPLVSKENHEVGKVPEKKVRNWSITFRHQLLTSGFLPSLSSLFLRWTIVQPAQSPLVKLGIKSQLDLCKELVDPVEIDVPGGEIAQTQKLIHETMLLICNGPGNMQRCKVTR